MKYSAPWQLQCGPNPLKKEETLSECKNQTQGADGFWIMSKDTFKKKGKLN